MEDINKIKMKLMKKVKVLVLMLGRIGIMAESEPKMELFSPDGSHYVLLRYVERLRGRMNCVIVWIIGELL